VRKIRLALVSVVGAAALVCGGMAPSVVAAESSVDVEYHKRVFAEFVALHPRPQITAAPGQAGWDGQVEAVYNFWLVVPWDSYFGRWGVEGIDVSVDLQAGDDGVLRAGWSAVVPNGVALRTLEPIGRPASVGNDALQVGVSASACVHSSGGYAAETCIYNNVGSNASAAHWRNGNSLPSTGKTFRFRVGLNQYSGNSCYAITNIHTGPYAHIPKGGTYVMNWTSQMTARYGTEGWNDPQTNRDFLDCINEFI
jgi:hypothetical protein